MLMVQVFALAISGAIALLASRSGPGVWRIVLGVPIGAVVGLIITSGIALSVLPADPELDASFPRLFGAGFWFSVIGATIGAWGGRALNKGSRMDTNTEKKSGLMSAPLLIIAIVAVAALLAITFRFEIVPDASGGHYRVDRWTGDAVYVRGKTARPVTEEPDGPWTRFQK